MNGEKLKCLSRYSDGQFAWCLCRHKGLSWLMSKAQIWDVGFAV